MSDVPTVVRAGSLSPAAGSTAGIERFTAFEDDASWVGTARTAPGSISGWHVHPGHDTYALVLSGALRIESGAGGRTVTDAGPGDFMKIPKGVTHREGNPSDVEGDLVVIRVGTGPLVVNLDGPDAQA